MTINGETVLDDISRITLVHRYEILVRTHRHLEDQIASEAARPIPDSLSMQEMKRQRLRVKEEIVVLEPMLDGRRGRGGRDGPTALSFSPAVRGGQRM